MNSVEQIIAAAWAEILGMPQVDYETNFFALGGHSQLAIQCLSKLRERLPIILSLADFFEFCTVSEQANLVSQRLRAANRSSENEFADSSENWEQALLQQFVPVKDEVIPHVYSSLPRPLSPAQQRLWFMEQMNPDVPVYNEVEAVCLTGELNISLLKRALNQIVARHELLRSTIRLIEGVPHAVVHESWPLRVKEVDLGSLAPANQKAEVDRLLVDEPRTRYNLKAEPGIRVTLLRLGPREHILILMMHHIICDWSSEGIIWREFSLFYRSFLTAKTAVLPTMSLTHGDYAAWKQQQLAENTFADSLAFWEKTLKGAPALLELPADRPRPPIMSHQGDRLLWRLDRTLTEALRNTSRQEKTSLFTIFAAGLDVLLYRYTGTEDILLGIPLADRDLPELQSVIGFLLHVHVLRARISGDMTFRQLLNQVQKAALDMYMHRSVPFDQIVRKLHPERNLSYTPLFQVMLNWRDRDQQLSFIGLEGLSIDPLTASAHTSKFDLLFYITHCGEEMWLELEYNTDLFDKDRIVRMLGHYQTLLESVAADPGIGIAKAPLLTTKEFGQIDDWNRTESSIPQEKCFDELFAEQVERTPHATALVFEGDHLTYRQLAERTDQLAAYLQDLGVGRNTLVAICVERSPEMLIGLLGILKAGGAYLPLDPAFPSERLTFMLQDAQPFVLLTQNRLRSLFRAVQIQSVCLDTLPSTPYARPASLTGRQTEDLAYVLYTSGSTGTPKGVQIEHRALVNFLVSMQHEPGITAKDTLLALTTLSFDIAGLELYLPLIVGATVVIAPNETTKDGRELIELIHSSGATIMQATSATWRMLLDSGWRGNPGLKILCGGEAWGIELASELLPRCESLWNMYGPTETTIWSSVSRVEKDQPVLIGTPIANTTFYVLDSCGQPVPVGIPGELYIGGQGLARGYIWRNDLTNERFLPDPFRPQTGARMYRTGDLVRQVSDGRLEFLRRVDNQVKLRGFRIELGEIEAALEQNVGIHQCVVTVQGDDHADKRLVAYIVPTDPHVVPKVDELRGALKSRLPSYMIPAAFTFVERMPLTPNGKIDRKALPTPAANLADYRLASEAVDVSFTLVELRVKALWDAILGVPTLGVHSNFFESGGHSLLAVSLAAAIQETFHVRISLRTLFLAPTIREQAKVITELAGNFAHDHIVPLQEGDASKPAFFLIHSYHLYPLLPKRLGKDLSVYGIQEHSTHDQPDDWSLESLMSRYVESIRSVQPHGPYFIGGFCSAAIPAFEVARQLRNSGECVALLAIIDFAGDELREGSPKNGREQFRMYLDNAREVWQFHTNILKALPTFEVIKYLRDFAALQVKNKLMKLQRWWWSTICRFYMQRRLRMPAYLLGKLVAGIRIVTLEAVRNYFLKPFDGDIAVFLAAESAHRNPEDSLSPWAQTTSGKTEVIWLPGDHTSAFTLPKIDIFAQKLRKTLDAALESRRISAGNATEAEQSESDSREPHPSEIVSTLR